jgi:hypothetical protein
MKPKTVEVEWMDAAVTGGWKSLDDQLKESTPVSCRSAGYLLHRDKHRVVIAQNQDQEGKWSDTMTIPASTVKRVRHLK